MNRKTLRVACAVIEDRGMVLAAQRGREMSMPLKWEFPGGKLHPGESPEECLDRELEEELGVRVRIVRALPPVIHFYEEFTIELIPFVCTPAGGRLRLNEHGAVAWLPPRVLPELDWAAADIPVVSHYLGSLNGHNPAEA